MSEKLFDPESLAAFPASPGVYLMKDRAGEIVYVGKALNLRIRVRNYFTRSGDTRASVDILRRIVAAVDVVVTANEKEAFLLENTLIKQHRPRYNILLRDDKTYVSLRIRMNHDYPRVEIVRIRRHSDIARRDRDLYFGPYLSASSVRETLKFLLKVFPVRTCKDSVFRNRTRPCILHDVGKCCAPCVLPVSREDYAALVERVVLFLRGRDDEVRRLLETRMAELSEQTEFERAAMVRDRIAAMDATLERQTAATHERMDRDVVAIASQQGRSLVVLQQYRSGVLTNIREFYLKNHELEDAEVLYSFLQQHYSAPDTVPREVALSQEPHDRPLLEEWLREKRGGAVDLEVPVRGERAAATRTAAENAHQRLAMRLAGERNEEEALGEIAHRLGLDSLPRAIECVDISNIMGVMAVGSVVRFENGQPAKSGYRMYKIRTVEGSNDFAMMHEVLSRRFRAEGGANAGLPDLLIVDGGKGQLGVAGKVFADLAVADVALAAMAKSRLKSRRPFGRHDRTPASAIPSPETRTRFRTDERVFLPNRKNPVVFPPNSAGLFLLQRIRDEAHRFAITYHRKLRKRANQRSLLEEIPGVGEKRRKALLRHFGSLTALRTADVEHIAAVDTMGQSVAEAVYAFLHPPPPGAEETDEVDEADTMDNLEADPRSSDTTSG